MICLRQISKKNSVGLELTNVQCNFPRLWVKAQGSTIIFLSAWVSIAKFYLECFLLVFFFFFSMIQGKKECVGTNPRGLAAQAGTKESKFG